MSDSRADQRVGMVCTHITYEIATGVFGPDTRLPTVREASERWRVDHRIVLKAYRRLESLGLVRSVPRSGYFVCAGTSHDLISRHRFELEAIFKRLATEVSTNTELSVLGAFRYLAQLAEISVRAQPECVFVECTQIQAEGHATEVAERLQVPCLPMTTEQIDGQANRVPDSVRVIRIEKLTIS